MTEEEYTEEDIEFGKRTADKFNLSLITVVKAVNLGNNEDWIMPMKHYINMGFINAETELKIFLEPEDRKMVFDLVVNFLEKHRSSLGKVKKNEM